MLRCNTVLSLRGCPSEGASPRQGHLGTFCQQRKYSQTAFERIRVIGAAISFASLVVAVPAHAETITANCTGMLNLDRYEFDTEQPEQDVAGIGPSKFLIDEQEIRLLGDFGEYRFDLNVGTLYHNGTDTGLYCTYRTNEN